MSRTRHLLATGSALWLGLASLCAAAEERIALVIGNARYAAAPLRNPVNDATAIADSLKKAGFAVDLRTDVSQRDMTRAISQFGARLKPGSVGLFYYAGHGLQVRGRNFLVPIDAEISSEASVRSEAVDVDLLLEQLGPARLSMVILDACRNNPFEGKVRTASGSGLAQVDAPKGTLIAYATAPGKVAADGEGPNGVYTSALLRAIESQGLKVEEVFKRVRIDVARTTANLQIPWESSSLTGDFFFKPGPSTEVRAQDLKKALDEEKARRERDSAALKAELEALRAHVASLGGAQKKAPGEAPKEVAADRPGEAPKTIASANPEPQRAPEAFPSPAQRRKAEWDQARTALASSRGSLTFSKAMGILLGASSKEEVDALLEIERTVTRWKYNSALALGVSPVGGMPWGRSYGQGLTEFAEDEAVRVCEQVHGPGTCTVVMVNGVLNEERLVSVAERLGKLDMATIRKRFLTVSPKP